MKSILWTIAILFFLLLVSPVLFLAGCFVMVSVGAGMATAFKDYD